MSTSKKCFQKRARNIRNSSNFQLLFSYLEDVTRISNVTLELITFEQGLTSHP